MEAEIFVINPRRTQDLEVEMLRMGLPRDNLAPMAGRGLFRVLRVSGLSREKALKLKGFASAAGIDIAMPLSDEPHPEILLMGTGYAFQKCLSDTGGAPEGTGDVMLAIREVLARVNGSIKPAPLVWNRGPMTFGNRTYVMGIINCTPDSFYDGGVNAAVEDAMVNARRMMEDGVDIVDVGGESTRPGSDPVSVEEEISRTVPFIRKFLDEFPHARVSIDTVKAGVAEKALEAGAGMINDISGLRADPELKKLAAASGVPVCIMHMQGTPKNMQQAPRYPGDVCYEISRFFRDRIRDAVEAGVKESQIVLDPGIGFGKTLEHNLEILSRWSEFCALGRPLLAGASRKSFIGKTLDLDAGERLEGSLAAAVLAVAGGADIVRVHDVRETIRAVKLTDAVVRKKRMLEK